MSKIKELSDKLIKYGKYHLVDTTALLASSSPFYSLLETTAYGMTNETSTNARLNVAWMSYAGIGLLFAKGRDLSRKIFQITNAKESIQKTHDALYASTFNLALCPILYVISGAGDWKEIVLGTIGGVAMAIPTGIIGGYSIDTARDLTGLQESQRVPRFLKNKSPKLKKAIAAGLVVSSLGLMGLIYSLTPNKGPTLQPTTQQIEHQDNNSLEAVLKKG